MKSARGTSWFAALRREAALKTATEKIHLQLGIDSGFLAVLLI